MASANELFNDMEQGIYYLFYRHVQHNLATGYWRPSLDIYELADRLLIVVELPGVRKEDVKVLLDGDTLTIEGRRPDPAPGGVIHRHQMEIDHGEFRRRVKLTPGIDEDGIEANLENGYLYISIPKEQG